MLDTLLDFDGKKKRQNYPAELIEKLMQQAMIQSIGMDDRNLTRSLSILKKHLLNVSTIEEKRLVASRAQHFIDRYVDLVAKNRELDYN